MESAMNFVLRGALVASVWAIVPVAVAMAGGPRVLPEGKQPNDARLAAPKDLNGYFPFAVPKSKEEWAKRAEEVRRQIAVAEGIWPLPERTPLNVVTHGRTDKGDYIVEKVYFESVPFTYGGRSIRVRNAMRLFSPTSYRYTTTVSIDGGPFINYGNPWWRKAGP